MARIAIASYYAPPQPAVASHRVLRLSRVLLDAGHQVHWVTLSPDQLPATDRTLVTLIPEAVKIHGLGGPCIENQPITSLWGKIKLNLVYLARDGLALPDAFLGWVRRLKRALPRLVREEGLDALYFCCGPHSPILLLPGLRRRFPDLTLLVDYRDLLSGNAWNYRPDVRRCRRVLRRERVVLAAASGLFLNTSDALERFRTIVQPPPTLPLALMRNAADYDLAERMCRDGAPPDLGDGVHLGYFGTVFEERRLRPVLAAIADLPPEQRTRVRFHCYAGGGRSADVIREDCAAVGLELGREVLLRGSAPYAEAFLAMRAMDGLVLVNGPTADDRLFVPGKLFDYLMARRPVLFLGAPGDASRIVSDCCGAEWCSEYDTPQATRAMVQRLLAGRPGDFEPNETYGVKQAFQPVLDALS